MKQKMTIQPKNFTILLALLVFTAPIYGADTKNGEVVATLAAEPLPAYLDRQKPLETRVDDLLSRLTLEEKIETIHAGSKFTTPAIPRLGIQRRWLDDGSHGVREDIGPLV